MITFRIEKFLKEAPEGLQRKFAYACANRALYRYAVQALREAEDSDSETWILRAQPQIRNRKSATAAADVVRGVLETIGDKPLGSGRTGVDSYQIVRNVLSSIEGARDIGKAEKSSLGASDAALIHKGISGRREEIRKQEEWIRSNWTRPLPTQETLAAVDAYIADGLLLGDGE